MTLRVTNNMISRMRLMAEMVTIIKSYLAMSRASLKPDAVPVM